MDFGENLKKAREAKGFTQQHLADKIYVTRQAVSKWECGTRFPDLMTAKCLADILGVTLDSLISDEEIKNIPEKQGIIQDQAYGKVITSLFALISVLSVINVFGSIMDITKYADSSYFHNAGYIAVTVMPVVVYIIISILGMYSFVKSVKGEITPKVAGVTGIIFYISLAFENIAVVASIEKINIGMLCVAAISLAMAIVVYRYFFMNISNCRKLLYIGSGITAAWVIANPVYETIVFLTDKFYDKTLLLNPSRYIEMLISLTFIGIMIVQAIILERKRKMVKVGKEKEKTISND